MAIELPPLDTKHWTVRRKAAVVQAVRIGMVSLLGACLRYGLSVEEFLSWQRAVEQHGIHGLRVTRLQILPRHRRAEFGQREHMTDGRQF